MSRLTGLYKLSGTKSFRRASSMLFGNIGQNVQNPSHTLMGAVIPDEGKVFLQIDQSGAEARCVAYEADDGNYRQLFENDIKPHTYLALQIFIDKFRGTEPKERYWFKTPKELKALPEWPALNKAIKQAENEYALGKMTAHAASYDMRWKTFQINVLEKSQGTIRLTVQEAKFYLEMFGTLFPEVIRWQERIKNKLMADRTLVNLFGYSRTFYNRWNDSLVREGYSWIPQSTIGLITSMAICEFDEYVESHNLPEWEILGDKHDSALIQVPAKDVEAARELLTRCMSRDLVSTTGVKYRMETEIAIGLNWDKYHPIKNPQGLK